MTAHPTPVHPRWNLVETLAGWIIPGLGHYLLGQRRRGLILAGAILSLWTAGLLIGAVGVIDHLAAPDRPDQSEIRGISYWFIGQAMVGPSLLVDWYNHYIQNFQGYHPPPPPPPQRLPCEPSFSHVNEQGVLYTTLAGLLNLLALIDIVYCDPQHHSDLHVPAPGGAA